VYRRDEGFLMGFKPFAKKSAKGGKPTGKPSPFGKKSPMGGRKGC
jgi:hypothetical protein